MSIQTYNVHSFNNLSFKADTVSSPAIIAKPIESIENVTNNIVDTFTPSNSDEDTKKSNKTAIAAGSTVLVLGLLVALLNPKTSGKMINKLKASAQEAGKKAKTDNTWKGKIYRGCEHLFDNCAKILQFVNNTNSIKDESLQWLCTQKKDFSKIKNTTARNILTQCDNGFRRVTSAPHKLITKTFDKLSKHTVKSKLKSAETRMDKLETLISQYKDKLSNSDKQKLDKLLNDVKTNRQYFTQEQLGIRLDTQEKLMKNLEQDTVARIKPYIKGLVKKDGWTNNFKKGSEFWAESIMMPTRNQLEKQGNEQIAKLISNAEGQKGTYNEIAEIITPYLSKEEKATFEKAMKKTHTKLNKLNKCECIEYFDKKRDLMLGSAPTDVLSAAGGIALSGIAIGTADDKDKRISRAVTLAFPAIAGLGANLAFTAMLFSGGQGIAYSTLTSIGLSKIGSFADKHLIPKQAETNKEEAHIA